MARSSSGWYKVYRLADDHLLMGDPAGLFLWWKLLSMATYRPTKVKCGKVSKEIDVGTVITSRDELALKTGLGAKVIRSRLDWFANGQMIGQQKTSRGTVITICNWKKYQEYENDKGQQKASEGPAEGQPRASEGPLIKNLRIEELKKLEPIPETPAPEVAGERLNKPKKPKPQITEQEKAARHETWEAYKVAFKEKYGHEPTGNVTIFSQVANFVKRIGQIESPAVAKFYLGDDSPFIVNKRHSFGLLLSEAEKYHSLWKCGEKPQPMRSLFSKQVDHREVDQYKSPTKLADRIKFVKPQGANQ